jgi:hypothetical protein
MAPFLQAGEDAVKGYGVGGDGGGICAGGEFRECARADGLLENF